MGIREFNAWGVTLRWTSIPLGGWGARNTPSRFMLRKIGDKRRPDEPLSSFGDGSMLEDIFEVLRSQISTRLWILGAS